MPDMTSNPEQLLQHGEPEGTGANHAASTGSFKFLDSKCHNQKTFGVLSFHGIQASSNLRLVFPSVQENASAVAILPHFLEVCGRKIDNCAGVQDWDLFKLQTNYLIIVILSM